ncbi:hypothetical protein [Maribacter sp. LLG6340-A2]|uniref:hypothetical protein n=1 Tax=Maribacter sp. LLG6340-A2 TaxID=3160834 RepID=UPI003865AAC7
MEKFTEHIESCFKLVERKFGRGPSSAWDTNDFNDLGRHIQEETGTLLSVSTLKRLSGKINYSSQPNKATLNALAEYIGYPNWVSFANKETGQVLKRRDWGKTKIPTKYAILLLLLILAFLTAAYLSINLGGTTYDSNNFVFNGESVSNGLPNSVVFNYDATAADDQSKIEIQQDWDESKRVIVNKNDSVSTSIYYRPGFFKSKLVVDGNIVKEKDILIPTKDWVGVIETDSIPIYLDMEDYQSENSLSIKAGSLEKYGVDPRAARTPVGLYQIKDFGELYTSNFEMSALVRNDFRSGKSICQLAQLVIVHEDGPISIMLTDKGCISDIMLHAFGKTIDGKKTDLSGFGVDFQDFVELKCVSKNGKLEILLDNQAVFSFDIPDEPKKILGCSIHFEGAGTIQNLEFKNEHGMVYSYGF